MTWSPKQIETRFAFASASLLCLAAAWAWLTISTPAEHCLQLAAAATTHCAFCWGAAVLAVLAVAPYPLSLRRI